MKDYKDMGDVPSPNQLLSDAVTTSPDRTCVQCGARFQAVAFEHMGRMVYPPEMFCPACLELPQSDAQEPSIVDDLVAAGVPRLKAEKSMGFSLDPKIWGSRRQASARWIQGRHGSGKTTQAVLTLADFIERRPGKRAVYTTEPDMLADLCRTRGERLTHYADAALLVLDECGRGRGAGYEVALRAEYLGQIIDARYTRDLPMICVSNVNLFDIQQEVPELYSEWVWSRIFEMMGGPESLIEYNTNHRLAGWGR